MAGGHVVCVPDRVALVTEVQAETGVEGAARLDVAHDEIHLVQPDRCHGATVVSGPGGRRVRRGGRNAGLSPRRRRLPPW